MLAVCDVLRVLSVCDVGILLDNDVEGWYSRVASLPQASFLTRRVARILSIRFGLECVIQETDKAMASQEQAMERMKVSLRELAYECEVEFVKMRQRGMTSSRTRALRREAAEAERMRIGFRMA